MIVDWWVMGLSLSYAGAHAVNRSLILLHD